MPLVILHNLLDVSVQLANKRGFKKKEIPIVIDDCQATGMKLLQ
jgi:hypothetical protein